MMIPRNSFPASLLAAAHAAAISRNVAVYIGVPETADGATTIRVESLEGTVRAPGATFEDAKDVEDGATTVRVGFEIVKPAWGTSASLLEDWKISVGLLVSDCSEYYYPPKRKPQPYYGPEKKKKSRHERRKL